MSDKIALFAGSFDPITNAHIEIIDKASRLFDQLYVGVFYHPVKQGLFDWEERVAFLNQSLECYKNVEVIACSDKLAVDVAKIYRVTHFVRGLRNAEDLEYEAALDFFNHKLSSQVETVYFMASVENRYLSSSRVRELLHFGADIGSFVPNCIAKEVEKKGHEKKVRRKK